MSIVTTPTPGIFHRLENAGRPNSKTKAKKSKQDKAITTLVEMDERLKVARGSRNKAALLELAAEYAVLGHGCPDTAAQITNEAMNL